MVRRQPPGSPQGGQPASGTRKRAEISLSTPPITREFERVLESAATLQRLVPDTVLVGGSAAALHAGHRLSTDHDHVLANLQDRFDAVLDGVETDESWQLNRMTPGKIILGELGDIETGIRQMRRSRPLEVEQYELASGSILTVPTADETLRIKAFLSVQRNQVRDYLDIAALADKLGIEHAAAVLAGIDEYYAEQRTGDESVATQVARQLSEPHPKDSRTLRHLAQYKGLAARWASWEEVTTVLGRVAVQMLGHAAAEDRR